MKPKLPAAMVLASLTSLALCNRPNEASNSYKKTSDSAPRIPERQDFTSRLKQFLTPKELAPEEEAEPCITLAQEVNQMDANGDPVIFLAALETVNECQQGLSQEARNFTYNLDDSILARKAAYLLRCTPPDEPFKTEHLEQCEEVDLELSSAIADATFTRVGMSTGKSKKTT